MQKKSAYQYLEVKLGININLKINNYGKNENDL